MSRILRVGTRGSDLAVRQTQWVCDAIRRSGVEVEFEPVVIATDGDLHPNRPIDEDWPAGGFVGAIERALLDHSVDVAVHSHKDLPSELTRGLMIAAVPQREAVNDVLLSGRPLEIDRLPTGLRVGTSSARRAAQLRRMADVQIVPIRGNVPTRMGLIGDSVDAVILAAAGLRRLDIRAPHELALPVDRFVPAPAQGALAVQVRVDDEQTAALVRSIDDAPTRRTVAAERALLAAIGAGCRTAIGGLAIIEGGELRLHGQLFSPDGARCADRTQSGDEPLALGRTVAESLMRDLGISP